MTGFMNSNVDEFLAHAGVKGMKWGKRKAVESAPLSGKKLAKAQKKYDKKVKKNWVKTYNETAAYANDVLIPKINKKYAGVDFSNLNDPKIKKTYDKYVNEYDSMFNKAYDKKVSELFGERPS